MILTPMIDVIFVLLLFFVVTTTFTRESHLKVDLPEAQSQTSEKPGDRIEVVIGQNGSYAVNGDVLVNSQMKTLLGAIEAKGQGNKELAFVISADANVPYEKVMQAMDAAGRLGYAKLSMTTQNPSEEQ